MNTKEVFGIGSSDIDTIILLAATVLFSHGENVKQILMPLSVNSRCYLIKVEACSADTVVTVMIEKVGGSVTLVTLNKFFHCETPSCLDIGQQPQDS